MPTRLEFIQGTAAKFWEIDVQGSDVITRWGRIGTDGQTKTKPFASPQAAQQAAAKQEHAKRKKGYADVGVPTTAPRSAAVVDIEGGGSTSVMGSSGRAYTIRNQGGVWDCSCPAWLHQSAPIARRTCKHIRALRGDAAEVARLGALPVRSTRANAKSTAPGVLLAMSWEDQDPTGWWMSEKLDGVRAWWDGSQFWSRQGTAWFAPAWFTAKLPDVPLDGELFVGRGCFQDTMSIVGQLDGGDAWRALTFMVFDAPEVEGPFEERLAWAESLEISPHARVLEHKPCEGQAHLRQTLERIELMGGEGLMLREPKSAYVQGRSSSLLKVKTFHDAEATVVGHAPGKGRHVGRLGALQVELPDGTTFKVGSGFTDAERESPPPIGTVITFRYQELTRAGVPRFPTYLRIRQD